VPTKAAKSLREVHPRELKEIVREIPTLPVIYQQLFQMMQDPDVTIANLAGVISKDQALTAKLLHLVNSAFYGYNKEIRTISRALVVLGFRAVRNAALALSIFDQFKGEDSHEKVDLAKFWEHSIAVACICKTLASHTTLKQAEEAFVVGLLHDVGKLITKRYFPQDFDDLCDHLASQEMTWYDGEKQLFKVDHAIIGKAIFRMWDFPPTVVEAIQFHHKPDLGASLPQLIALTHVGDYVAYHLNLGGPLGQAPPLCDPECLTVLGITEEDALVHHETYLEETQKAMELLKLVE
jgi:putative nucleotidyltransferase with HDIG domain